MKLHLRLILSGIFLLVLAILFGACSGETPTPMIIVVTATVENTPIPTELAVPVLEIVGPSETRALTLDELKSLPVTEGYAGIKSSTGKITPPIPFKGVALKDLAQFIGGMDETAGFNVVAEDGYGITFSFDQIENGSFIAYDPATGTELKKPVELTAILAFEMDGKALDPKQDGVLRLAIISPELNQVTDGHWSVKWVNKLEVKSLGEEWVLQASGVITKAIDRASLESCGAPQCHGASWTDDKDQEWVGVPLYYLVGSVDDEIEHEGPAFNRTLADAGYNIDVIATDGYTVTFDAARVQYNKNIIVAYKVNENQLPDEYFPLRLVGDDLKKNEMAGMIAELKVGVEPVAATEVPAALPTEATTSSSEVVTGSLIITGAVRAPLGFTEADLRAWEVLEITAEHPKKGQEDYEGVSLNALLDLVGVQEGATKLFMIAADGYTSEIGLDEVRACTDCLLGFTNTPEKFKMVMPNLPSSAWAKDVIQIEVK
jgi:hypothetical protein